MKWRGFQPELDRHNFGPAVHFVDFGTRNDMYVVDHVLFWQNAVPDWVFEDGQTWLNNWPMRGRTNHPLLFDRDINPKPAFHAVLQVAKDAE